MRKLLPFISGILLAVVPLLGEVASASDQTKNDERLRNSGRVLKEILDVPDNIPQDLLDKADCVVVLPSVLKAHSSSAEATGEALCRAVRVKTSGDPGALPR
jgi:lipid-binding SYLF domain-containing protein